MHERDRKAEWFTVSLGSLEDPEPTVQVTDRFRKICEPRYVNTLSMSEQCPSIVSFIGNTGAGKSTLVNAMSVMGQIESQVPDQGFRSSRTLTNSVLRPSNLPKVEQARRDGPVTRSGNPKRSTEPTSSGVHLYLDPGVTQVTYLSDQEKQLVPILFADCEGFGGGTNTTNAERSVQSHPLHHSRRLSSSSLNGLNPSVDSSIGRNIMTDLAITLPEIKDEGKAGAELYYARFLYAFSDVIVFVTEKDQQFHKDLQALLEWAASAVHKSINHHPRKSLIVVQNMPSRHNTDFYSESFHKSSLFNSMDNLWEKSRRLSEFKKRHDKESLRREGEIYTNEKFINMFFQSVEVCYVPNKGLATSAAIMRQYRTLRRQIVQAVELSQQARSVSWTRYDVSSLSHLFGRAFYHFAKLPGPFDFYAAARKDNPMSVTMADHIANLLRYMQAWYKRFETFHSVVAVCLITFVQRDFRQAIEPKEVFDRTLRRVCTQGIQHYQDKYQRCSFKFEDGQRCKAIRLNHPEHCNSDERGSTAPGTFDSADYQESPGDTVQKIEHSFIKMFKDLCSRMKGGSVLHLPPHSEFAQYRRQVLTSRGESGFWQTAKSSKTCFTCLQSVPDHGLPCGHVFCEQCIKDFGQPCQDERSCFEMSQCVLCLTHWPEKPPQRIRLKPNFAGVRVLTLDGGGIRGIVELAILAQVERRVGLGLPIRDLFDLVVGTSTGGIIALGLAMTEYNLGDITENFIKLSERTFKSDRGGPFSALDPLNVFPALFMFIKAWDSKYRTTPLREGLINLFGGDMSMFPASTFTGSQRRVRVAVTSSTSGLPCIFANYNRMTTTDNNDFEREDEQSQEARVWEAALATSAAPVYFKPFERGSPPKLYSDGALHANLPIKCAMLETQRIWTPAGPGLVSDEVKKHETKEEDSADSDGASSDIEEEPLKDFDDRRTSLTPSTRDSGIHLDTLVSIGTGLQNRPDSYPVAFEVGGLKAAYLSFIKAMDTETGWAEFKRKATYDSYRHHRLNVPINGKYVRLDDWSQMQTLEQSVHEHYRTSLDSLNDLQDVAASLTASLLFFEPDAPNSARMQPRDRFHRIQGQIWCRLARDTPALRALVDRVTGFYIREDKPRMSQSQFVPVAPIKVDWKSDIRTRGQHLALPITIKTTDKDSLIVLAVRLRDVSIPGDRSSHSPKERRLPISGFPAIFKDMEEKLMA